MAAGSAIVALLAKAIAHVFYRVDVVGAPPGSGPLLLLPNHPNALLDPALVIATSGREVRFLAKSTLFSGPFAPLLRAANAIPVYRRQDGVDVDRNAQTFAAVDAALARGEAVCLFPEGISHSSGRLEALRTGAARMAISASERGVRVELVPVGINLESKTVFRSRATVAYGHAFVPASSDPRAVTAEIASHMRAQLVEADPLSDAALVERIERLYRAERPAEPGAQAVLQRRRLIAAGIDRLRSERPEWYEAALIQFRRYDDRLRRFRLHDTALGWEVSGSAAVAFAARELPLAALLVPLAASALAIFAVPYFLTAGASRLAKEMDVTATTKAFAGVVLYGAWVAVLAMASYAMWGIGAAAATALLLPALAAGGLFAIERELAAWRTARSWLALRAARPATREALRRRRAEVAGVLDEVNEWMRASGLIL